MNKFRDVSGKTAIVTGSCGGLGFGIAESLASEGVNIVMMDIKPKVEDSFKEIMSKNKGIDGLYDIFDVSDESRIKNLVEKTIKKFGRLDIMINNVKTGSLVLPSTGDEASWDIVTTCVRLNSRSHTFEISTSWAGKRAG